MAHSTLLIFPANAMLGITGLGGEERALHSLTAFRPVLRFQPEAEHTEMAATPEVTMPAQYGGATLNMDIHFFMATANTGDIVMVAYVEALTPNSDTLDMEATASWDVGNSQSMSLVGSTAGDPLRISIPLTNDDNTAAGDLVRFGIKRDTDDADDDASGYLYVTCIEIWENT